MNIFERAVREKTRFNFKGSIGVEELWDLSLENLDKIYGNLSVELDNIPKRSLLDTSNSQRDEIEFKQEIIKYIVEAKKTEAQQKTAAKENSAKKQMLLEILEKKKNQSYENMSVEELTALVNSF